MFIIHLPVTLTTAVDAAFGQYLPVLYGLDLKYGAEVATAVAHVAVNNHLKVAALDLMHAELFV
jgi:hypothetical protein